MTWIREWTRPSSGWTRPTNLGTDTAFRSTYFSHITGGYAVGYYGYIWSGVLDHDAFAAFEETSLFDQETAQRFRNEVLAVSGTADFMDMWVTFRGREPEIDPLLRNLGLQ